MKIEVYICLAAMLFSAVAAVMSHKLLRASVWLAVTSIGTGALMFLLGAPWAAIFEISVCSGLVTVIFISAISLSNSDERNLPESDISRKRTRFLPVILIVSGVALVLSVLMTKFSIAETGTVSKSVFNEVFWNSRQADIWGQMIVLLTGALAVTVFFKERD